MAGTYAFDAVGRGHQRDRETWVHTTQFLDAAEASDPSANDDDVLHVAEMPATEQYRHNPQYTEQQ